MLWLCRGTYIVDFFFLNLIERDPKCALSGLLLPWSSLLTYCRGNSPSPFRPSILLCCQLPDPVALHDTAITIRSCEFSICEQTLFLLQNAWSFEPIEQEACINGAYYSIFVVRGLCFVENSGSLDLKFWVGKCCLCNTKNLLLTNYYKSAPTSNGSHHNSPELIA